MATDRMVVWRGLSPFDGVTPIIVLATGVPRATRRGGVAKSSGNVKTGNMIQIHIVVDDILPLDALQQGMDTAVCGVCPHKGIAAGGSGACYVNLGKGQNSMMRSHLAKGSVAFDLSRFAGQRVRFGAYGDPTSVPFEVFAAIAEVAEGFTGYTHQWRECDQRWQTIIRASADSVEDRRDARLKGWKTFRVRRAGDPILAGELSCPASKEQGFKTTCSSCLTCSGTDDAKRRDVTIIVHGPTLKRFKSLELSVA